jgi:hypothetical protein
MAIMINVPGWFFDETIATARAALDMLSDESLSMDEREIASSELEGAAYWLSFVNMPETVVSTADVPSRAES